MAETKKPDPVEPDVDCGMKKGSCSCMWVVEGKTRCVTPLPCEKKVFAGKNSLFAFKNELQLATNRFVLAYMKKHEEDPENYPLTLPKNNSGLWMEFFIDYFNIGTM